MTLADYIVNQELGRKWEHQAADAVEQKQHQPARQQRSPRSDQLPDHRQNGFKLLYRRFLLLRVRLVLRVSRFLWINRYFGINLCGQRDNSNPANVLKLDYRFCRLASKFLCSWSAGSRPFFLARRCFLFGQLEYEVFLENELCFV